MNADTYKNQIIKGNKSISFFKLLNLFSMRHKTSASTGVDTSEVNYLLKCLSDAREEWIDAGRCFDYAGSREITDYCTYRLKACEVRYDYFLKKAKEMGISTDGSDAARL